MKDSRLYQANRVTWIGFFANLLLTLFKLLAGILGRSAAMVADAVHSISDFGTDLIVVGSLKVASRPRDGNHKYGHGKVETLATAFVGGVLFIVGLGIFGSGLNNIIGHYTNSPLERPGMIAFYAALGSIAVKEVLFRYTLQVGHRIYSQVVVANAWHHRSDVYSSLGTVAGIGGAIFLGERWVILDPLAAMAVSFFIFRIAFRITRESLLELIETSLPGKKEKEIIEISRSVEGVYNPHDLKTRKIGNNIAIDLHIEVVSTLNVEEAHNITVELEKRLRQVYGQDTFISVHTEPLKKKQ
jgi:cation diffusion facilitator family transporter